MIYLIRHGESVVNIERRLTCRKLDGDLTALGREQAVKAARWLSDKGITAIQCSPFVRARQTAEIIGDHLGLIPAVGDDLREMDCGELEGRTDDAAWEAMERVFRRWLACDFSAGFPGGETYGDAVLRFKRVLAWASAEATPLLVTHGGIATTVIPLLCVNAAAMQRLDGLGNTGFVILDVYDPGRYVCEAWNLVEHLD